MSNRDILAIDFAGRDAFAMIGEVGHDLMAVEIEIDPMLRGSTLGAPEKPPVKDARLPDIADWKRKMKAGNIDHMIEIRLSKRRGQRRPESNHPRPVGASVLGFGSSAHNATNHRAFQSSGRIEYFASFTL
jgi:hypothetical protein